MLRNLHRRFDWHYIGQFYGGDFAKFCGLLRIYELYHLLFALESIGLKPGEHIVYLIHSLGKVHIF